MSEQPSLASMSPLAPSALRRAASGWLDAHPDARQEPSPAKPKKQSHAPFYVSLAAMGAGQAADVVSTAQALKRGAVESNPVYGKQPSLARITATKAATMVPTAVLLDKLYHHHPKIAMTLAGAIGAVGAGLAVRNTKQGRQ